jgi:putative spermidine/putrescine transport system ATP-binding protein
VELHDVPRKLSARRGHRLQVEALTHRFGDVTALREVDLEIGEGELVALLGPSGCGKSTLLRVVAGFIAQSEGRVRFDGEGVDHLSANRRGVGIVFQSYALFPHMSVRQNIAYGLEAQRWTRTRTGARVEEMLMLVHMMELADRLPRELSGGQQQRVALARCLAVDPKLLLLDEPFSALDKNLRLDMQIEVKRLQREYGITTILVTHDQDEALSMADRIAVMNAGRIEQFAPPNEIYDRPATLFVNGFVGTANLIPGRAAAAWVPGVAASATVSVRPEQLRLRREPGAQSLAATVKAVLPLGPQVVYEAEIDGGIGVKIRAPRERDAVLLAAGERVFVEPAGGSACQVFTTT